MTPERALAEIRGPNTKDFLFNYIVSISGSAVTDPAMYSITTEARSNQDNHDSFRIQKGAVEGGTQFQGVSVPMLNYDTMSAGIVGLKLPNDGLADVMLTGQLTSCTFMYSTNKHNMYCTHIEPTRAVSRENKGIALGVTLSGGGLGFSNDGGEVRYFTKQDYPELHHVNILGVRRANEGWTIYVQGIDVLARRIVFSKQLV